MKDKIYSENHVLLIRWRQQICSIHYNENLSNTLTVRDQRYRRNFVWICSYLLHSCSKGMEISKHFQVLPRSRYKTEESPPCCSTVRVPASRQTNHWTVWGHLKLWPSSCGGIVPFFLLLDSFSSPSFPFFIETSPFIHRQGCKLITGTFEIQATVTATSMTQAIGYIAPCGGFHKIR